MAFVSQGPLLRRVALPLPAGVCRARPHPCPRRARRRSVVPLCASASADVPVAQVEALREAIMASSLDDVRELVSASGAALVNRGYEPVGDAAALHLAAFRGNEPILDLLLEQDGVTVDVENNRGNTPLQMAAIGGHVRVAAKLIIAGADGGHVSNDKATALDYAVEWGQEEVETLLMKEQVARIAGRSAEGLDS